MDLSHNCSLHRGKSEVCDNYTYPEHSNLSHGDLGAEPIVLAEDLDGDWGSGDLVPAPEHDAVRSLSYLHQPLVLLMLLFHRRQLVNKHLTYRAL